MCKEKLELFYKNLDAHYSQGNLDGVENFLLHHITKSAKNGSDNDELIAACNELGSLYRNTSRFEESVNMFLYAKELVLKTLGDTSVQYATVLNNMAGTYRLRGDYETSVRLFEKALNIYRECRAEGGYDYTSVLNNMALAYRETKQISKAIACLEEARSLIENMPDRTQELAITYNNLAALYTIAGEGEKAMSFVKRAIEEFEKCQDEENVHYAAGLNTLAAFLYARKDYLAALELYEKSARYTKRFFGENLEYGVTFQNMYWVYDKLGKRKEAIESLEKAELIFKKLLGPDHERTRAIADDLKKLKSGMN